MQKEILMPKFGLTMEKGIITRWYVKKGDEITKGDPLFNVETDKITQDVEAEKDGFIAKILKEAGLEVKVKTPVAVIVDSKSEIDEVKDIDTVQAKSEEVEDEPEEEKKDDKQLKKEVSTEGTDKKTEEFIRISPRARKLAESESINLESLNKYTDRYRIIEKDVLNYLKEGLAKKEEAIEEKVINKQDAESVEISQIRKTTAKNLTKSWQSPHAYLKKSIVVDKLIDYLDNEKDANLNTAITYLTARTLKDNKFMNAHWLEDEYKQFNKVNMGMAVAIKRGLIVPVLKNANDYSVTGFSKKAGELIGKAKNNKLEMDDLQGATFTVTNLGMYGIDEFTAVINPPQVGILSVGKIYNDFDISDDSSFRVVKKINFVIGFDHRAIDGAQAAEFLNDLEEKIESIDSTL